jgi:hypothetical protein
MIVSSRKRKLGVIPLSERGGWPLDREKLLFLFAFASVLGVATNPPAWAWGDQGHEIIAIIAADNLSPTARQIVAKILGAPPDVDSLEKAMAAASIRPDTEFREEDRSTAPWHFIDICLQDRRSDVPERCPGGACVTAKIDEYTKRLKAGECDKWGGDGDLAFLIHFVGDIHQPLHAATNADLGGNCIVVESRPPARNLHAAWDTTVVDKLEDSVDLASPATTAHKLEQMYAGQKAADSWKPGETDDIAWESNQIARSQIYEALGIPVEPCQPDLHSCTQALNGPVDLDSSYMSNAATIAGQQLAKAGFRLASLLNTIWPSGSRNPNCPPAGSATR